MPSARTMYQDGSYLQRTGGTWDLGDSPFKSGQVVRMFGRNNLRPSSICDIGCGAGGVLAELQKVLPSHVELTGYDISPQAHEISKQFINERCRFLLDDPFADGLVCDVALALDVFEHVEDCFAFLRQMKRKAKYKVYHVPLEVHASAALRAVHAWPAGHLHQFSRETALRTIEHSDQEVVDWFYTEPADTGCLLPRTRLAHVVRRRMAMIAGKEFTARLLGGYSLMVLAV
jgi:SAM-dependent methyltransferase